MRLLFIYTSQYQVTGLPIGIASLVAVMLQNGHDVKIFDTAFYPDEKKQDIDRHKSGTKEVTDRNIIEDASTNMYDDLKTIINDYGPDVIGITLLEPIFELGMKITGSIKQHFPESFIIAGGVFPTLSPFIVLSDPSVDAVCVGEGETSFLELVSRMSHGENTNNIQGIWVKNGETIIQNGFSLLNDLELLPFPNFEYFDRRIQYKPMQGRLYKMINIPTSRGCPNQCAYCAAPQLTKAFRDNKSGNYFRKLSINRIVDQIYYQIEKHDPEFIYFSSETFLTFNDEEFKYFIEAYRSIKLPFWIQTRFETMTYERLKALKDVGLFWITCGIEHGSEEFRRKYLKRNYSNVKVIEVMEMLNKLGQGVSLNNIMGFPFETRELIFDTINLNRRAVQINPLAQSEILVFAPFHGSHLHTVCKEEGLIDDRDYFNIHLDGTTDLQFSEEWKLELKGLLRAFILYVRLPEEYYPKIKMAEQFTQEGNMLYQELFELAK